MYHNFKDIMQTAKHSNGQGGFASGSDSVSECLTKKQVLQLRCQHYSCRISHVLFTMIHTYSLSKLTLFSVEFFNLTKTIFYQMVILKTELNKLREKLSVQGANSPEFFMQNQISRGSGILQIVSKSR